MKRILVCTLKITMINIKIAQFFLFQNNPLTLAVVCILRVVFRVQFSDAFMHYLQLFSWMLLVPIKKEKLIINKNNILGS